MLSFMIYSRYVLSRFVALWLHNYELVYISSMIWKVVGQILHSVEQGLGRPEGTGLSPPGLLSQLFRRITGSRPAWATVSSKLGVVAHTTSLT